MNIKSEIDENGFAVSENSISTSSVNSIRVIIDSFIRDSTFGERQFLSKRLDVLEVLKNDERFMNLVKLVFKKPVIIRSLFFDKPPSANWIVNWHQDLTLDLTSNNNFHRYIKKRSVNDRIVVSVDETFLSNITTLRVHLDDTNKENGGLRVIPKSHKLGIIRTDSDLFLDQIQQFKTVNVKEGGVMIMKPLLLHSSRRSSLNSNKRRRVIHLEFAEASDIVGIEFFEALKLYH